jgi:hypothetical protein
MTPKLKLFHQAVRLCGDAAFLGYIIAEFKTGKPGAPVVLVSVLSPGKTKLHGNVPVKLSDLVDLNGSQIAVEVMDDEKVTCLPQQADPAYA